MSKIKRLVVVIKVNTIEPAIPVLAGNYPRVVFEYLDNPPVLPVPIEVWVGSVSNIESDTISHSEGPHSMLSEQKRTKLC